jgi:hypothetical protein
VTNVHTCSMGGVNLIISLVLIMDCQLFQFTCDMICYPGICVPIGVDSIRGGGSPCILVVICNIVFIKSMSTIYYMVAFSTTQLALRPIVLTCVVFGEVATPRFMTWTCHGCAHCLVVLLCREWFHGHGLLPSSSAWQHLVAPVAARS